MRKTTEDLVVGFGIQLTLGSQENTLGLGTSFTGWLQLGQLHILRRYQSTAVSGIHENSASPKQTSEPPTCLLLSGATILPPSMALLHSYKRRLRTKFARVQARPSCVSYLIAYGRLDATQLRFISMNT